MSIFQTIALWLYRNFLSFLLIVLILALGKFVQEEYNTYVSSPISFASIDNTIQEISLFIKDKKSEAEQNSGSLKQASLKEITQKIVAIDHEIKQRQANQPPDWKRKLAYLQGDFDSAKGGIEIEILNQELTYLKQLQAILEFRQTLRIDQINLERLRLNLVESNRLFKNNKNAQLTLEYDYPIQSKIPFTAINIQLNQLQKAHINLEKKLINAAKVYKNQKVKLAQIKPPQEVAPLLIADDSFKVITDPINIFYDAQKTKFNDNWFVKLKSYETVIPAAFAILVSILFFPLIIKSFFYYIVAPITSKRPPVRVLKNVSGKILCKNNPEGNQNRISVSAVSQEVLISDGEELLVHAEYLQSTSQQGLKDTKWLMDYKYPLSSLASGMFALTRIRANSKEVDETYVISSLKDPLIEIGIITIPIGAAIVLQPHSLVGIVQQINHPVFISHHWRLANLNAWLTLQLRFLVFHGPATLIIKGCRGIKVERAGLGRNINQASTIGFSANLPYSTTRCETFVAYLMGKQELLNDHFSEGAGYYIYEEMPYLGKKSGITGRGLEGISDSILKVFGI
ncbi:MAG: hypothetical protein WBP13_06275 [Methylophilaceae bacterium]